MIQREMECDLPYLDSLTSAGRNDPCRRTDLRDMEFRVRCKDFYPKRHAFVSFLDYPFAFL